MTGNLEYFKLRSIQIDTKDPSRSLPQEKTLRSLLKRGFGNVHDVHFLRVRDSERVSGPPNTAIVVFHEQESVEKILQSSRNEIDGSFWQTESIKALPLIKKGPINEEFVTKVVPKLQRESKFKRSGRWSPHIIGGTRERASLDHNAPPPKRSRTENWDKVTNAPTGASILKSSAPPGSSEWMRARIAQLEVELDTTKAARDMAVSEQEVTRTAYQAEQRARREAMSQKSAAEAALSRKEAEQDRICSDLETALAQKSALSHEADTLREQLTVAEDKLNLAQSSLNESLNSGEQIKALKMELEGARDQVHKLQLRSSLELSQTNSDAVESDNAKAKLKHLKIKVKQMKSDLASAQDQLASAQRSLESMERKYSSARGKYESAKAKVGVYKERLENERAIMRRLRDTLTPAAYQSLGATHETLGAFLSAMDLPPVSENGITAPKEESD